MHEDGTIKGQEEKVEGKEEKQKILEILELPFDVIFTTGRVSRVR